jgi:hypothetical protein
VTTSKFAIVTNLVPAADLLTPLDQATETPLTLTKRAAWVLDELLAAGPAGISKISYPGVNVGDAILKCRKAGVHIETEYEQHRGEFAGHHGRYILRSKVIRLDTGQQAPLTSSAPEATHV